MNALLPKQFLLLHGEPVLMHTIRAFHTFDKDLAIILALPETHFHTWKDLCRLHAFTIPHKVTTGGPTRFCSVKNALEAARPEGLVAIHDGARPLVSQDLIRRTFALAEKNGNAIPVLPVTESLREVTGDSSIPADRSRFRIVQTPQVFHAKELKKAYASAPGDDYADDATVLELTGETIHLVEGDQRNIKITVMGDLETAEAVFQILRY
jgi:2-C-methyl-D-erythritol 4-phosphate cytidylyltransferase